MTRTESVCYFKRRLSCNEATLLTKFEKAFQVVNETGRRLILSLSTLTPLTQIQLSQEFVHKKYLKYSDFCSLALIMIAIPVDSAWVERAFIKLK